MNIQLTGVHLDITPAIRQHVMNKIERTLRNAEDLTSVNVVLSVEKIRHKVEATIHVKGKSLFVEAEDQDLYAAVDLLVDKLDRQMTRHKEKKTDHSREKITQHLDE